MTRTTEPAMAPAQALLRERYELNSAQLTRSERRVADYLLSLPPAELAFVSAEQLAEATGTSDASVIRTARRLGFSGLPELKRLATRAMATSLPVGDRLAQKYDVMGSDIGMVAGETFAAAHEALQSTLDALDADGIAQTVQLLEAAEVVWCLGIGTHEIPARHCAMMLARAGLRTRLSDAAGFALANDMVSLRPADVVIVFQSGRYLKEIGALLDYAAGIGAKVILVSGVRLHEHYRDRVAISLISFGTASRMASWAVGAITLVDLIVYGFSARNRERVIQSHTTLDALRHKLS